MAASASALATDSLEASDVSVALDAQALDNELLDNELLDNELLELGVHRNEFEHLSAKKRVSLRRFLTQRGVTKHNPMPGEVVCVICMDQTPRTDLYYIGNAIGGLGRFSQHAPHRGSRGGRESWQHSECGHMFCIKCMSLYIENEINVGRRIIRCPGQATDPDGHHLQRCQTQIYWEDVRTLVSANVLARGEELRNADYRGRLTSVYNRKRSREEDSGGEAGGGGGGGGGTSDDDDDDKFCTFVKRHCMACPRCSLIISRSDGCSDIICTCGSSFCYECGTEECSC